MSFYDAALKALLFRLPPDRAHDRAQAALRWGLPWRILARLAGLQPPGDQAASYAGVALASPVGLAAGFDKNCDLLDGLSQLGFGFLTVGSVMPAVRFGNPFPRLVRHPDQERSEERRGGKECGRTGRFRW